MPFLFVIITFITVLLEQCSACHIHLIHYGCDLLIKYTFLSECIPTSCFKAWLVLVGAWKSAEHKTESCNTALGFLTCHTISSMDSYRAEGIGAEYMFGCCFRLSILSLSPLKCCPECNNCKYHMLRYRIEKSCSVAYGISVFEVKKISGLKAFCSVI